MPANTIVGIVSTPNNFHGSGVKPNYSRPHDLLVGTDSREPTRMSKKGGELLNSIQFKGSGMKMRERKEKIKFLF